MAMRVYASGQSRRPLRELKNAPSIAEAPREAGFPGSAAVSNKSKLARPRCARNHSHAAAAAAAASPCDATVEPDPHASSSEELLRPGSERQIAVSHRNPSGVPHVRWPNASVARVAAKLGYWNERLFTAEQIEFESNLDETIGPLKLVDHPTLCTNAKLWICLMDYRQRRYGQAGVLTIWRAIRSRGVKIPFGRNADKLWTSILDLGFKDPSLLQDICRYANELYDTTGRSWPRLYVAIMQHLLVQGDPAEALRWHDRLIDRHPPSTASFSRLAGNVFFYKGDATIFRELYLRSNHRNAYSKIIPILLSRQDFQTALQWHFFLLKLGDLPPSANMVEPLVQYLAVYDHAQAVKVTNSLVTAGVSFGQAVSANLEKNVKISREMMNIVHGETFNIGVKKYNDRLGARWFATRWVSLDIAINAIHALGVEAIGPLSLHAMALREMEPKIVVGRIEQMKELGISIGDSVFSKALDTFARREDVLNFEALLKNDQHPDAMEDWKLQEALMASYARAEDWAKFRHTLAVRTALTPNAEIEEFNLILRCHATNGDRNAILRTLEDMRDRTIPAKPMTIRYMLQRILGPRRRGHSLVASATNVADLNLAISILKRLMESNCFVPVTSWKEIIRRLGMMGRLNDLDRLCTWLAAWYEPDSNFRFRSSALAYPQLPEQGLHLVPSQVPTSHPLHPLRILFPDSLQKAIVEWGFIHAPTRTRAPSSTCRSLLPAAASPPELPPYTRGITLLHRLHKHKVAINASCVRRAIYTRLVILHGPGRSKRRRNSALASQNVSNLDEMVRHIDGAWGGQVFPSVEALQRRISMRSRSGLVSPSAAAVRTIEKPRC
ncbi:MAG: hypothetical protein M1818_003719 [Claussenomyces sp. TS43310]|nr:MAG: hypothetical protein M1818_003719 [Claussenomyces sp. TS43310]